MKKRIRNVGILLTLGSALWLGMTAPVRAEEVTDAVEEKPYPELAEFSIAGEAVKRFDTEAGEAMLYRNLAGADVQIRFHIEAEEEAWDAAALRIEIVEAASGRSVLELKGDDSRVIWEETGERSAHRGSLEFDGEAERDGVYQVRLTYYDPDGNGLEESGTCESELFILDHQAPKLQALYSDAVRTVAADGRDLKAGAAPTAACSSYYRDGVTVKFIIEEAYADKLEKDGSTKEMNRLELDLNGQAYEIDWKETDGDTYTGSCVLTEEQAYQFRVVYHDAAGNAAEAGNEWTGAGMQEKNGSYESPRLVIDRTPPCLSVQSDREPEAVYEGRSYYGESTMLRLTVTEENLRLGELRDSLLSMTAEDSGGAPVGTTAARRTVESWNPFEITAGSRTLELPLTTEANYRIPLAFTDLAGNPAIWEGDETELLFTIDRTAPDEPTLTAADTCYGAYAPYGWLFSDKPMKLRIQSADATAGIRKIRCTITDENGKQTIREQNLEPAAAAFGSLELLLPEQEGAIDFKGTVQAEVWDYTGRKAEKTLNCGVESEATSRKSGEKELRILTRPGRVVDGTAYYNSDVDVEVKLGDAWLGMRCWQVSTDGKVELGEDYSSGAKEQELTYRIEDSLHLPAADYNRNDLRIQAEYTDQTGRNSQTEIKCNIDVTQPEITVVYDQNTPIRETYYREPRTATVTIRERNFDERDVEFQITNAYAGGTSPVISSWTHSGSGDEATHTCRVVFEADGAYTFGVAFQDLAGNRADYDRVDSFVIDRASPELTVTWDNTDVQHGFYYKKARTASLSIREPNFDAAQMRIEVQAEDGGEMPRISDWSGEGEFHTASVHFTEDGTYSFTVTGKDLADNELTAWESERFIVDQTPPELEIFDIRDRSANNGEVRPGIRSSDAHYDPEGESIVLNGYRNGLLELTGQQSRSDTGMEYKLEDMPMTPEQDDLYTLTAAVADLAGNRTEQTITFSVNRYGSVYTLGKATEQLAGEQGSYYTREEPELVIIETNVDTLNYHELTGSRDGKLTSYREGRDYQVTRSEEAGWQQYTYRIGKENFTEEGVYVVTLYSEDRARNVSDNRSKGKRLEFAVDKSAPEILLSGVEQNGRYTEAHRTVLLDVQDNLSLKELQVHQNGQTKIYDASELRKMDGRIELPLDRADDWQELQAEAWDAAGNRAETEVIRFLLTPERRASFLQPEKQAPADRRGLTAALGCGMIATVLIGLGRRRKKIRIRENNS